MKDKFLSQDSGSCYFWLTWKLLRKQKLRTAAIFCGLLFSGFLLNAFAGFGYDFWVQVHEGAGEAAGYDQTQVILISLVMVLLLLVAACSGILLHNLYSLTFALRWRSLARLVALGARPRDLLAMTLLENLLLYGASVLPACMLTLLFVNRMGARSALPLWLTGGIMLWIWSISCFCSIRPLWAALHRPSREPGLCRKSPAKRRKKHIFFKSFSRFMTKKYRQANRGHHVRIIVTILAAIMLYVPVSYLIDTNIRVQRAELEAKHGIQYDCSPRTKEELAAAMDECRGLADDSSFIYVAMPASAAVKTDALSWDLRSILSAMGWREDSFFPADGTIYFLEDRAYAGFLESCGLSHSVSAVLIDRYINRSSWSQDASPLYQEVPILNAGKDCSAVEVYYKTMDELHEFQWDKTKSIFPDAVTRQIPEGLSLDGTLSLCLPLSRMEDFVSSGTNYRNLYVCGKFQDPDETTFSRLERALGKDSLGGLRYTRKILQEWYASMSGIHRAMTAICSLLFAIAVLNIFSMMLFQYMERKRGLAILWSLGLKTGELLKILTREHIRNLLTAIGLGIPISGLLCYYIYKIFRRVWQVDFELPLSQTVLIAAAACILSFLAILAEGLLMRRQDFLKDISDIT